MTKRSFRSEFMLSTISRFIRNVTIATIGYVLALVGGYYFAKRVIIWQPTSLYWKLKIFEEYLYILVPLFWFCLILLINFIQWIRTVSYIEDIAKASSKLVTPEEEPIKLPLPLRSIEDSMNQIKRTALKNERAAKEAEQRKNDLVVNLAHDIRTPLASVIGYLNLLDEASDMPEDQRTKYIGITLEKAYRLEQLIEEFFEITRFNLSSIVLNKGKINLSYMLAQIADEFFPMLAPGEKQVQVHAPEELILWGDADKLSRVFNNILKNAIAYSYDKSIIDITATAGDGQVILKFVNSGDPIPAQKLETIFERFYRLDSSRSSQTGGAGLGLAIAKEIVVAHKGSITAESEAGKTTFTVVLPQG